MEGVENMEVIELEPKLACKWMAGRGRFARMGVQGDGSCFFHSVCAIMNTDNYLHATELEQRDIAYAFRCKFAKRFSRAQYAELSAKSSGAKSFAEEHDGFCAPEVWADEVMIRYASRALDINLIFLDLENGRAYCGVHGDAAEAEMASGAVSQATGLVAWVDHRHFEPIVRVDDAAEGLITTLFEPAHSEEDADLVEQVMKTYAKGCAI